jgi:hypothetical protein
MDGFFNSFCSSARVRDVCLSVLNSVRREVTTTRTSLSVPGRIKSLVSFMQFSSIYIFQIMYINLDQQIGFYNRIASLLTDRNS